MRIKLLAIFLAAAFASSAVMGANLSEIYLLAKTNDAEFSAAQASYQAGLEKLPQGKSLLRPNINLFGNLRENDNDNVASTYGSHQYGIALKQSLYRKQDLESYEQAKLQVLQAEQALKVAEQRLQLRVAQAYFAVLQAQDVLATAQSQKQAFGEQLAQARKSFEVGVVTITDTHEAQARFDLTSAQEIAAQNDLEVKRRALEKIINSESPELARLSEGAELSLPQPNNMDAWVKQAEADSLAVALGQTAQESARREIEKQKAGHHPTVDFAANYGSNRNASSPGSSGKSGFIGVEFAMPLYQGGATEARIREAIALQNKSRHDLENARRQARLDARQGFLGVLSGEAQAKALEQALVSSEAQLRSTKLGLEVGVRTRVDVLNAQQQLYTTRRDLAAARYQTLLAGLQLKAAAGILNEEDLKAIDTLLK
jgi:outer membrane protein